MIDIENNAHTLQLMKMEKGSGDNLLLKRDVELENTLSDLSFRIGNEFLSGLKQYDYKNLYELWARLHDEIHLLQLDKRIGVFLYYTKDNIETGKVNIQFCLADEEIEEMNKLESWNDCEITFVPYKEEFLKTKV